MTPHDHVWKWVEDQRVPVVELPPFTRDARSFYRCTGDCGLWLVVDADGSERVTLGRPS